MRKSLSLPLPLLAVALTACGTSIEYVPLNAPPRPLAARAPESVEVFTSSVPNRPYVEIGTIEAHRRDPIVDGPGAMYAKMRKEAGRQGCDALVVADTSTNGQKSYRASCLVYTNTEP